MASIAQLVTCLLERTTRAQTAAHLVDHVIPHVQVRHWVLSLPIPLRLLLAARPKLVTSRAAPPAAHTLLRP